MKQGTSALWGSRGERHGDYEKVQVVAKKADALWLLRSLLKSFEQIQCNHCAKKPITTPIIVSNSTSSNSLRGWQISSSKMASKNPESSLRRCVPSMVTMELAKTTPKANEDVEAKCNPTFSVHHLKGGARVKKDAQRTNAPPQYSR